MDAPADNVPLSAFGRAILWGWPSAVMALPAWNAGFSRHSPPQAGGGPDLMRRDGSVARANAPGVDEAPAGRCAG